MTKPNYADELVTIRRVRAELGASPFFRPGSKTDLVSVLLDLVEELARERDTAVQIVREIAAKDSAVGDPAIEEPHCAVCGRAPVMIVSALSFLHSNGVPVLHDPQCPWLKAVVFIRNRDAKSPSTGSKSP